MANLWESLVGDQRSLFPRRHIGPSAAEIQSMLQALDYQSLDQLIDQAVPANIREKQALQLPEALDEHEALAELKEKMSKNRLFRSLIGLGYHDTITPAVVQRNILENPAWYTQYTPYQAEIAQGRLEALLNFQTMITDLTGLDIANASLLDEGTAAAEAMTMSFSVAAKSQSNIFFVSENCHPQTISVVQTRAEGLGIQVEVGAEQDFDFSRKPFGLLLQYPASNGAVSDDSKIIAAAKQAGALVTVAADIMALVLLKAPGELGADIAVGSSQRFGVPLGYGGPHAGYFATRNEYLRRMPGRLVGVSKDADGRLAFRLTLQTREQHIRRDKATSNICTAQVLLAIMASMYAVYHGPDGLKKIAIRIHAAAESFARGILKLGFDLKSRHFFDSVAVCLSSEQADKVMSEALANGFNLRRVDDTTIVVAFDEKSNVAEVKKVLQFFGWSAGEDLTEIMKNDSEALPSNMQRQSEILSHETFQRHRSETQMMRYIRKLESRDLSLTRSMIPLGSCTMKLNAAIELMPITWPEVNSLHPFVPLDQAQGYQQMFTDLENWLAELTGFDAISLQPNSGAQGEYAGLMVIKRYLENQGQAHRKICLIPSSAHGTNPASAVLAGMKVVVVKCDNDGNIDVEDLQQKAQKHKDELAALMITYPSTHGVFEQEITRMCDIIHENGGQVYMDGANLNAQIGLCKPGKYGPDVCHMNLHKTFCIPHGGGGPGMGPIGVKSHLAEFLPNHPLVKMGGEKGVGPIAAAPWGSPSILPISWMYIRMMGGDGLTKATKVAILNANYMAKQLESDYPVVYRGINGRVAHECIIDLKELKKSADITVEDVAKRLIDYGYHAPTVSWPVPNSMMIEPTESESKDEMDRFCSAMIQIREEIREIEKGQAERGNNVVKNAPHTAFVLSGAWDRPYSRDKAAFPLAWVKDYKFWPHVSRIDNAFGDRNVVCACPPLSDYES
ncbi:MAG: aminomethyl-transferring glycine dehydrogenase [Oligoflexus sp.]